jgi:GAF domain-containing protein/anti-sigma regulatory factor (Ser/Thr protein kinase)
MPSEVSTAGADQQLGRVVEELKRDLERKMRELAEAREQQAATAEILASISSSVTDADQVFAKIAASAARLCEAHDATIFQVDRDGLRIVAHHGPISPGGTLPLTRAIVNGCAVLDRRAIHVADLQAEPDKYPEGSDRARLLGHRTILAVPLIHAGKAIGTIAIRRTEVRPFTDRHIELLKTFADQAVIAIENTRLFAEVQTRTRELTESLEYQTATSEVLGVISRSPTDAQPVFESIAQSAAQLCGAQHCNVYRFDGRLIHFAATHLVPGMPPQAREANMKQPPIAPGRGNAAARSIACGTVAEIPDIDADPDYERRDVTSISNLRSTMGVPMLKDGHPIGAIVVSRLVKGRFSERQIKLLQTFADQAVIAIENTRLFEEVQEKNHALTEAHAQVSGALERETATSEILRVIGSSPTDVQPVFETIARSGVNVCGALGCVVLVVDGGMIRVAATHGVRPERLERFHRDYPMPLSAEIDTAQTIRQRCMFHLADIENNPNATAADIEHARLAGYRTRLMVPMVRGDRTLGLIAVTREDPTPFPDQLVELLKTFADQAVIAIENTRLFEAEQASKRELQESLEYQTATSEVLNVISRSPTELKPVLDAIAATAARLCESKDAVVWRVADGEVRAVAEFGRTANAPTHPLTRRSVTGRAIVDRKTIHVHDLAAMVETEFLDVKEIQQRVGHRTTLATPLLSQGEALGAISVRRNHVHPFSDRQIALLQTFADQAVIAIENARLFEAEQERKRELQESLEYQTATSEVLNVISRSPAELQPVLNTIVETASRLCKADHAHVFRRRDDKYHLVAHNQTQHHIIEYLSKNPIGLDQLGSVTARAARACKTVHVPDAMQDPEYGHGPLTFSNDRTVLSVPLLREGIALGVVTVGRQTLQPFTGNEIELVESFADQAVIAIENTRLFEEVQAKTRELQESLEYQTATSDVLGVISRSPTQLQPVVDAIVQTAKRLCEAETANMWHLRDDKFDLLAHTHKDTQIAAYLEQNPIPTGQNSFAGRAVLERRVVHVPDIRAYPEIGTQSQLQRTRVRTMLVVPLLRQDEPIGTLSLARTDVVRPFSDKQIELVTTFADQAVIAINNVGLFEEVQARNRDLTALGEVGRAVSSTLDLKTVLKSIVDRAVELSGTDAGSIFYYHKATGSFELGETTGLDEDLVAKFRKLDISAKETGLGEVLTKRQPLQIPDLSQRPREPLLDAVLEAGFRASLIVPLLAAEGPLGALILRRRQPGVFPQSVVSLMQAFADQSAIALENARLFNEIAEKSRELEIASQHKSQFVANMSHELRTPLAAILGFAELMQEGFYEPLGQKSLAALTRIRSNGKHLLGLINTVLDIAKIESGQFNLNLGEYALESVVETVRAATEALAETKKLGLRADVAKRLPIGVGDEQRLTQVLLNLVGNAIKFTDVGEVCITATASNGHFALSVTDTGPGIPQEHQARIFDQFHQVDSSNTKAKGGTGLGLAIAKQIVEMHGGRIWVESIVGRGSTFRMELPVRAQASGAAA